MTPSATQALLLLHSDPALSPFHIELRENEEDGRWELWGEVPSARHKRRAGTLLIPLLPRHVRLLNALCIRPDIRCFRAGPLRASHRGTNTGLLRKAA